MSVSVRFDPSELNIDGSAIDYNVTYQVTNRNTGNVPEEINITDLVVTPDPAEGDFLVASIDEFLADFAPGAVSIVIRAVNEVDPTKASEWAPLAANPLTVVVANETPQPPSSITIVTG
jgi:hypothetical protein